MVRYNTTFLNSEIYNGTDWVVGYDAPANEQWVWDLLNDNVEIIWS
jgi:hypothetical protein